MEALQAIATSIGVIGLILLMLLLALHFFGTKTAAWICSNREEKIGFSKSKLYHANGYLIHSGSEFLLNSTGSFKRFDSIDRDYKPVDQTSLQSPSWTINIPDPIPPQPLRLAPKSPTFLNKSQENSAQHQQQQQQQQQLQNRNDANKSSVIPRPITKRQHSSPANCGVARINLSDAVAKITNGPRSCTNPFLNGSLSISEDSSNSNESPNDENEIENQNNSNRTYVIGESIQENPFTRRRNDEKQFFSFPSNGNIDDNNRMRTVDNSTVATLIELDESISTMEQINNAQQIQQFRNRSLSDIETDNLTQSMPMAMSTTDKCENDIVKNPFYSGNLHKTVSDTYLEQYSLQKIHSSTNQTHTFSRTLSRQSIPNACSESTNSINSSEIDLKRAMSCDSVNSESSVVMADLEQQNNSTPSVTGQVCVGLQYDKSTLTDEGIELVITLMEAKDLIGPSNAEEFDTFVRIYLVPDEQAPLQTKLFRNSKCPTYNETFSFWLSNKTRTKRSLWFHLYHSGSVNTLIGETEFQIGDVRRPITTWLTLSDSRHNNGPYGELMFSLSYLPTAERLTVVVVKARNLKLSEDQPNHPSQNVFVKVYLLKNDKKVSKKRTSIKRSDSSPIYNESMMFSVPPYMLKAIQIRLTVVSVTDSINSNENSNTITIAKPIGHVIVGCATTDKGLRHWNQMLTSLRKPVAMWHAVRQTAHPTGNTESGSTQTNLN